jgi:hypothetical protein
MALLQCGTPLRGVNHLAERGATLQHVQIFHEMGSHINNFMA